jgi:hypothetical protein
MSIGSASAGLASESNRMQRTAANIALRAIDHLPDALRESSYCATVSMLLPARRREEAQQLDVARRTFWVINCRKFLCGR